MISKRKALLIRCRTLRGADASTIIKESKQKEKISKIGAGKASARNDSSNERSAQKKKTNAFSPIDPNDDDDNWNLDPPDWRYKKVKGLSVLQQCFAQRRSILSFTITPRSFTPTSLLNTIPFSDAIEFRRRGAMAQ